MSMQMIYHEMHSDTCTIAIMQKQKYTLKSGKITFFFILQFSNFNNINYNS